MSRNNCMRKKWMARLHVKGKTYYLGVFDSEEQAQAARLNAETRFHGSFDRSAQ